MRAFRLRPALMLATALAAAPLTLLPGTPAQAQIGISVNIDVAPPALPVYEQPPLPAPGYLWQPGYWAYGEYGYYWVPGTWVEPPQPGLLWTPGYWGFVNGIYQFNAGYWGPHVGFYGGIDYGFGYNGLGFFGGEWRGGSFFYNRAAVTNFGGVHITNVYDRTIEVNHTTINNVSFNGGPHGIQARPTAEEESFAHEHHIPPTAAQTEQVRAASQNRALLASENHGHPGIAATPRPGEFSGAGVVAARDATMRPEEAAHAGAPTAAMRATPHQQGRLQPAEQRPGEAARPGEAPRPGEAARPGEAGRDGEHTARPTATERREGTPATHVARPEGATASRMTRPEGTETGHPATHTERAEPSRIAHPEGAEAHRAPEPRAAEQPDRHEARRAEPAARPAAPAERPAAPPQRPAAPPRPAPAARPAPRPAPHAAAPHEPEKEHK